MSASRTISFSSKLTIKDPHDHVGFKKFIICISTAKIKILPIISMIMSVSRVKEKKHFLLSKFDIKVVFSICHHHVVEFFKADLTISVDVGFKNHLVQFLICEVDPQSGHDKLQLGAGHVSVAILVKHPEGLEKIFKILYFLLQAFSYWNVNIKT